MTRARVDKRWILLAALLAATVGCDEGGVSQALETRPPDTVVYLAAGEGFYGVGESVQISVVIENAANVGTVSFLLRFNPAVLQYVGGVEGTFMNSDGCNSVFLTGAAGRDAIQVATARLCGTHGASGTGLLATLEFLAVGIGDGELDFTGAITGVRDPQGLRLPALFRGTSVMVTAAPTRLGMSEGHPGLPRENVGNRQAA